MMTWQPYYLPALKQVRALGLPHAETLAEHHAKLFAFLGGPPPATIDGLDRDGFRFLIDRCTAAVLCRSTTNLLEFLDAVEHPISPRMLVKDYFAM